MSTARSSRGGAQSRRMLTLPGSPGKLCSSCPALPSSLSPPVPFKILCSGGSVAAVPRQTHGLRWIAPSSLPAHACSCEIRLFFSPPSPFLLFLFSFSFSSICKRNFQSLLTNSGTARLHCLAGNADLPSFPIPFPRGYLLPAKSSKEKLLRFPRGSAATGTGRAPRSRWDPNAPQRDAGAVGAAKLMSSTQVCPGVSPIPCSKPESATIHSSQREPEGLCGFQEEKHLRD